MTKAFALGVALCALIWGALALAPGLGLAPGLRSVAYPMHAGVAPQLGRGLSLVQDEDGHPEPCRSLAAIFALHGTGRILGAFQMHPPTGFTGPVLLVVVFSDRTSVLHPKDTAAATSAKACPISPSIGSTPAPS